MEQIRELIISADAYPELTACLCSLGYGIHSFVSKGVVSDPVSNHPDMFMCRLGFSDESPIISWFDMPGDIRADLHPGYPSEIAYNAACTGRFFIHSLQYTAAELIRAAKRSGQKMINVRQGYTKCSTVIVDENSIITYDRGIAEPCRAAGMSVLLISPGHVILPGYDSGFIGGTSGRIRDTVYFNGDLCDHPDHESIIRFIEERGLKAGWFSGLPLTDIGSII